MFRSFRTLRLAAVPLLAGAALAACSEDLPTAGSPRATVAATDAHRQEQTGLDQLTRAVAMALRDQGLRQKLKNDLRASRITREHKLELGSYLRGNGGILLAKMANETGMSRESLLGLIGPRRSIEFYFPVDAHRESWTGGDDLLVAAQLSDRDVPVGYRLDGTQVALSATQAPSTPTLAIVGAEADFTHPLGNEWSNAHDAQGQAIGTLTRGGARKVIVDPCSDPATMYDDPSCQPTYPTYPTFPAGLYLANANLNDYKESWPRGDPEIEVFLIGPTFNPANNGEKLSCSGQGASGYKYFDMNGLSYTLPYWQVEGQLFTSSEISLYNSVYAKPFEVQFWEDDQDACNVVTDQRSNLQQLVDNMVAVYQVSAMVVNLVSGNITPGAVSAILARLPATWENNDDFLGHARITSASGNSASAVLEMPGGTNGTVTFTTR